MKAKQLELFKETDFEEKHTYIKHYENWYLFDNVRDRKDFSCRTSNRYIAVCKAVATVFDIFGEGCNETRVAECDKQAKLIGMSDYLKLACLMRLNGKYIYNKRKCKLELKKN